jgi:ferredoxin
MPIDVGAVRRGCGGAQIETATQLCRLEIGRFRSIAAAAEPLIVGCTQEGPVFTDAAQEDRQDPALTFVNLRETAGWSSQANAAGPKMAALIAAAAEAVPRVPSITLASEGVVLIYGRDERAMEAAHLLKDHLDVTVMITKPTALPPSRVNEFPIVKGTIRSAKGHFGNFEAVVDDFATAVPSSRGALTFATARDGAVSRCDIILDLSGHAPLFAASALRDGYLRADPGDPTAVLRATFKARDLTGTFEKPRYIVFAEELCAHSRSQIVGCRRCLDLCPAGAIEPVGNYVAINPAICAGCGQCAAACPTGAAAYAMPPADTLMRKLRSLLLVYRKAGGLDPIVLFHDEVHGNALIEAVARYGNGLPANVLPVLVNEITQVGLEAVAATFAYGAIAVRFLLREKPRHDIVGLRQTIAFAQPILAALGFGSVATIETDDPDTLSAVLVAITASAPVVEPSRFMPVGSKREVLKFALRELHRVAATPVDIVAMPVGAPFGVVEVDVVGCTLCLSCVSACPTGALGDDPDRPLLRFSEDACVQCGLCKATCPEKVITLKPQIDFSASAARARVLKDEEPYTCIRCSKPFGVKSTIERIIGKLAGQHWMYAPGTTRLDVLRMCDDCRVAAVTEDNFDPHGASPRPKLRTTEDYLREREIRRSDDTDND